MKQSVPFLNMFSAYEPPEALKSVLDQAAIVAADIDPEGRRISVEISSPDYICQRNIVKDIDINNITTTSIDHVICNRIDFAHFMILKVI